MNYIAIFVAAIVGMIVGMVWYNPKVFGTMWMKMEGIKPSKKGPSAQVMVTAFVSQLVMAYVLARFIEIGNISGSIMTTLWLWLGFVGTMTLGAVLWQNKSCKLWALNNGHNIVSLVLMAVIIAAWP